MDNNEVIIREARIPIGFQVIENLWHSSGSGNHLGDSDTIQEIEKKLLRDPELFLVAIIREQIVGTVLGGFDGRRGMVYHLAVSQFFRNNGIGEKLMAELETRFQLKDCLRSYLLVTRQNL
jgi:ribosomal protein S18 acetylase RimI-like enzyme